MLIEFSVENYKSFRDRTTFSMVAANLTSEDPALDRDNVIVVNEDLRLLKGAALYGANASGKSNLGAALRFMRSFVLNSSREGQASDPIGVEPFLLDAQTRERPSLFEIVFLMDGRQYRYGFEADSKRVVSEWLFHVPTIKEATLFVRDGQEITVKAAFKEGRGLEGRTRENALFLSVAAQFNAWLTLSIQEWFERFAVTTGLQDDEFRDFTQNCLRDPELKAEIVAFLQKFDLGFNDVIVIDPAEPEHLRKGMPDEFKTVFPQRPPYIFAVHRISHSESGEPDVEVLDVDRHESQGTRKLLAMSAFLLLTLDEGRVLFVDEFDARLHPLITRRIIELFHSPETNPHGAQLIFITHDTNLLDRALFRRDQIWFAEKDRRGVTHLTSLAEFRGIRNDAAFEKQYLEGRYGAIPFLGDLSRLPAMLPEENTLEPAHA